jgi:D-glycero-D-manno-heptose 1,7-bisphosphate phosphatase
MSLPLDPLGMLPVQDLDLAAPAAERARGAPLRPCLFIDKDGTLIENVPYNVDPRQLRFMPGVGAALARLQAAGLALVIVTNQSGIARGHFSRAQFAQLQEVLLQRLRDEAGVAIDDLMLCPHEPDAQGRPACLCRKPAPGMLIGAARRLNLDLTRSWMVGDTLDDVEAGHRAGAGGLLFDSGGETVWRRSPLREPDAVFTDWDALAAHLLARLGDSWQGSPSCSTSGTAR